MVRQLEKANMPEGHPMLLETRLSVTVERWLVRAREVTSSLERLEGHPRLWDFVQGLLARDRRAAKVRLQLRGQPRRLLELTTPPRLTFWRLPPLSWVPAGTPRWCKHAVVLPCFGSSLHTVRHHHLWGALELAGGHCAFRMLAPGA